MTSALLIVFHVFVLIVDFLTLFLYRRKPGLLNAIVAVGIYCISTLIIAMGVSQRIDIAANVYCHVLFIHLPILALLMAGFSFRVSKLAAYSGLLLSVALVAVAVDAFFIEPTWLEVTHHQITSSKVKEPVRVLIIADIQTDKVTDYEAEVIRKVKLEKPDLILLAGDYVQQLNGKLWEEAKDRLNQIFKDENLQPPLGMYAVRGNNDSNRWVEVFEDVDINLIEETKTIPIRQDVQLTALSEDGSFNTQTKIAAAANPNEQYHICVGHYPNYAKGNVEADLLVAGHTHGGQVQIPLIGPIVTLSKIPNRWASGLTEISEGKYLIVSRGIGMERNYAPRVRFFCRPELVVIDIVPE